MNSALHDNDTSLHCAVRVDFFKKCELFLSYNPDLDIMWRDLTSFELAASYGASKYILESLMMRVHMASILKSLSKVSAAGETLTNASSDWDWITGV